MGRVNSRKSQRKTTKRTGRAVTSSSSGPAPVVRPAAQPASPAGGISSPWGRVDEEYALIKADLKRLAWVTALLLLLLLVLTYFLR